MLYDRGAAWELVVLIVDHHGACVLDVVVIEPEVDAALVVVWHHGNFHLFVLNENVRCL